MSKDAIEQKIISDLENTRQLAIVKHGDANEWDVSITLVFGRENDEMYPSNHLRNVALLYVKSVQQQQMKGRESAVLLVDADFRPSELLRKVLSSESAANAIIEKRQIIVCPAFEGVHKETLPETTSELKEDIDKESAKPFHSHFPEGHGPTNFEKYWEETLALDENDVMEDIWRKIYPITYESQFEPYIVMATSDIPLYDERFAGYYKNKISHIFSIAEVIAGPDSWWVIPGVFLFHVAHGYSEDRINDLKNMVQARLRENKGFDLLNKNLYNEFKDDLLGRRTIAVSKVTAELVSELLSNEK